MKDGTDSRLQSGLIVLVRVGELTAQVFQPRVDKNSLCIVLSDWAKVK